MSSAKRQLLKDLAIGFGLSAAVALMMMFSAHAAEARSVTGTITCDRLGCSDWHRSPATKEHADLPKQRRHGQRIRIDANGNDLRLVTVDSAAGPVTVSLSFAPKIVPLIAELRGMGFDGVVKCFSATRGNHVAHSLHFTGDACDFLPKHKQARGRNRMPTPAVMFTRKVADAIARAGLRNGCSFRDCGHIDAGRSFARQHWRRVVNRSAARTVQ